MTLQPESIPSGAESTALIAAPNLQYRQDLSRLVPIAGDEPLLLIYSFTLTVGQFRTYYCESGIPDKWQVDILPAAGVRLFVWNGAQNSGDPLQFTGGGYVRFPAVSEYVTILANLGTCVGNVIAWRKYVGVEISPGGLA